MCELVSEDDGESDGMHTGRKDAFPDEDGFGRSKAGKIFNGTGVDIASRIRQNVRATSVTNPR